MSEVAAVSRSLQIPDPDAMHELGIGLGRVLRAGDLVLLTGPLGAGKTTLTRGIGEGLGVRGPVQSPTFVLARTHPSLVGGAPLVHVDAYRLAGTGELDDLDIDFEGSVVVAEWGVGVVEEPGSWIEIVIERPIGGGALSNESPAPPVEPAAPPVEPAAPLVERAQRVKTREPESEPEDTDWSEALVESRTVTITGYGPRWREGVLS